MYICPVCQKRLAVIDNCLKCPVGHSYDRARQGYYNLLPIGDKNSKNPGDNAEMVEARRSFLNKGYYGLLKDKIKEVISSFGIETPVILDAGCGDGYYTDALSKINGSSVYGVDISKYAVKKASATFKGINFSVASVFKLPVQSLSVDVLTRVFAPLAEDENARVVKSGGYLVEVVPGENHLIQLKNALYKDVYLNPEKHTVCKGFTEVEKITLKYNFLLENPMDAVELFKMTPYLYTTNSGAEKAVLSANLKEITADFTIYISRKI